ncbi:MAG: lysophospholipid acyltransferase family protein [Proteobacteria bacterium]|nr:lysophospholipid acyltransferase family protein [Pseudomonadota bacterium]
MAEFIKDLTLTERFKLSVLSLLASWLVRLWFKTVRVQIINKEIYEEYFVNNKNKGNVILGSWHRHIIFVFYFFRKIKNGIIMVSRSKDGELISRVGHRLGYATARGSSSKGGRDALRTIITFIKKAGKETIFCGTAVDGPKGPARILKKGLLVLAKSTRSYFIPMACSGTKVITFHKAWDKTIIPYPFSHMIIKFGEPIMIPKDISEDELERLRANAENILNEITDDVDKSSGYTVK